MKKLFFLISILAVMLLPSLASASSPPEKSHSVQIAVCSDIPSQSVDQTYFMQAVPVIISPDVGSCTSVTQYSEAIQFRTYSLDISFFHPPDISKSENILIAKPPLKNRMRDTLIALAFY